MSKPKTIRTAKIGSVDLRLVQREMLFFGMADGKVVLQGPDPDDVWRRLHDEAGRANPRYVGFEGAKARFLKFFPGGFSSPEYLKGERDEKVASRDSFCRAAPLEEVVDGAGYGEAALRACRSTQLLSPFEKTWMQNLLRGPFADSFLSATATFAVTGASADFGSLVTLLKQHDLAKWTLTTYLPFLWRTDTHMFLKPEATKDFAERVGHPLALHYEAQPDFELYQSLLDLVAKTESAIADLHPKDKIDVQSFIWVVGNYEEKE